MAIKKSVNAHKDFQTKQPTNLSLHPTIKTRGLDVARQMGYDLTGIVEAFLEKLHEARMQKPRRKPGDFLQVTIFDRLPKNPKK